MVEKSWMGSRTPSFLRFSALFWWKFDCRVVTVCFHLLRGKIEEVENRIFRRDSGMYFRVKISGQIG